MKNLDFLAAKNLIERSQNIIITMHERMDGDDGGAGKGLDLHLKSIGKQVTYYIAGGVPKHLRFLPGWQTITDQITSVDADLLIICGCSTKDRCGNALLINSNIPCINIDHHPDNSLFGDINLVDGEKSSVAELVYDFFQAAGWSITPEIATCLLTGIFTDTGSFMHSNTSPSALTTAATLMRKGAHMHKIASHTFRGKSPKQMRAWGKALENIQYKKEKGMVYTIITAEDMERIGTVPEATFEGLVETLNKVPGSKFSLFLRQDGDRIKGSLRSDPLKNTNVNTIAKEFGGGGHKYASGFSLAGKVKKSDDNNWKVEAN